MSEAANRESGLDNGTAAAGDGDRAGKSRQGLSIEQEKALACLIKGEAIKAAALAAGVNRGTVYRWIKADALFRSAFVTWQQEQRESCRAALYKAAETAVARVATMVDYNEKLALALCKELGFLSRTDNVCTDLEMVQKEIAAEELEMEGALELRKLNQELRKAGLSLQEARQIRSMLYDPSFKDAKASHEKTSI